MTFTSKIKNATFKTQTMAEIVGGFSSESTKVILHPGDRYSLSGLPKSDLADKFDLLETNPKALTLYRFYVARLQDKHNPGPLPDTSFVQGMDAGNCKTLGLFWDYPLRDLYHVIGNWHLFKVWAKDQRKTDVASVPYLGVLVKHRSLIQEFLREDEHLEDCNPPVKEPSSPLPIKVGYNEPSEKDRPLKKVEFSRLVSLVKKVESLGIESLRPLDLEFYENHKGKLK